jgi:hypothetical protein
MQTNERTNEDARTLLRALQASPWTTRTEFGPYGPRSFALSVKFHGDAGDASPETFEALRADYGLHGLRVPPSPGADALEFGPDWIRARAEDDPDADARTWEDAGSWTWEEGRERLAETFEPTGEDVELRSAGRSGGYALVSGLEPEFVLSGLQDLAEIEDLRERLRSYRTDGSAEEIAGAEARLLEIVSEYAGTGPEFRELQETEEALALLLDLRTLQPGPLSFEILRESLRDRLRLAPGDPLPLPEEILLPDEEGERERLSGIVRALLEFAEIAEEIRSTFADRLAGSWAPEFRDLAREHEERTRDRALLEFAEDALRILRERGLSREPERDADGLEIRSSLSDGLARDGAREIRDSALSRGIL